MSPEFHGTRTGGTPVSRLRLPPPFVLIRAYSWFLLRAPKPSKRTACHPADVFRVSTRGVARLPLPAGGAGRVLAALRAGSSRSVRVPWPGRLSRRIDPPLASIQRIALARPMPRRRPAVSALKHGSNARFAVFSSIPQPLSVTVTTTCAEYG